MKRLVVVVALVWLVVMVVMVIDLALKELAWRRYSWYGYYFVVLLFVTGCATTVRSRNGVILFTTSADVTNLTFSSSTNGERVWLTMTGHTPSRTIRASGSVTGTAIAGAAEIITSAVVAKPL